MINESGRFSYENSSLRNCSVRPGMMRPVQSIVVDGATSLILMFSVDSNLPANVSLTVFADEGLLTLINLIVIIMYFK